MTFPILSFFTGGGFLDLGFSQAGFTTCWTNENNPAFIKGYKHGMSTWFSSIEKAHRVDIAISNSTSICELSAPLVIDEAFSSLAPNLFGVIGGPPCPDFSSGGTHAGGEGTNGRLTSVFVDMLCAISPSFFVIENVPGLYRFHKHRDFLKKKILQLEKNGYNVDYNIPNSLEFGVPQDRERLFVVGFKHTLVQNTLSRKLTSGEKGWFPWPEGIYTGAKQLPWPKVAPFGKRPKKPTGIPIELTVHSVLTDNGDPEKLANGNEHFYPHSSKFWEIQEGDVSRKSFKRLHRYRFSPTAWYGNQEVHLHPWKARRLSVREALRIQSVPDEYILPKDMTLSAKFKMICNGVPCVMAFNLANAIKQFLRQAIL